MIDLPKPGLHYGVPFVEYAAWPAVNQTALKILRNVTPFHCRAFLDGRYASEDSDDRRFGRAEHCYILEPETFAERFVLAEPCKVRIASGKRKGDPCGAIGRFRGSGNVWSCGIHKPDDATEPEDYITVEQLGRIKASTRSLLSHKVIRLIRQHGGAEVSVVWERDGLPCKARLDKLVIDTACPDTILDLKKIRSGRGTDEHLQRSIRDWGYDIQSAWYIDGVEAATGKRTCFAWVFLEDNEPFDVRPVWASRSMVQLGRRKLEAAWQTYKRCVEEDRWPGYCESIEELEPSPWEVVRHGLD